MDTFWGIHVHVCVSLRLASVSFWMAFHLLYEGVSYTEVRAQNDCELSGMSAYLKDSLSLFLPLRHCRHSSIPTQLSHGIWGGDSSSHIYVVSAFLTEPSPILYPWPHPQQSSLLKTEASPRGSWLPNSRVILS